MVDGKKLLSCIVMLGEKGADIARIIRKDKHLLELLVREKSEAEKNPRFVHDFKTLADVLIQQVVKYHLHTRFVELEESVLGEESDTFQLGDESVRVEVGDSREQTEQLLSRLLQDQLAAHLLSLEVHRDTQLSHLDLPSLDLPCNLAVWIDPIDSTAEYIHGDEKDTGLEISNQGVRCVTLLIGVFSKDTGEPLIGLINQPFYRYNMDRWIGRHIWGVCLHDSSHSSLDSSYLSSSDNKVILISSSESESVKQCLQSGGYQLVTAAGAGNKGLGVVLGVGCAYVLSRGTTYPWDICAVDGVLRSLGGGVVNFTTRQPLIYGVTPEPNSGGLIAFRNKSVLTHIAALLDTLPHH